MNNSAPFGTVRTYSLRRVERAGRTMAKDRWNT